MNESVSQIVMSSLYLNSNANKGYRYLPTYLIAIQILKENKLCKYVDIILIVCTAPSKNVSEVLESDNYSKCYQGLWYKIALTKSTDKMS